MTFVFSSRKHVPNEAHGPWLMTTLELMKSLFAAFRRVTLEQSCPFFSLCHVQTCPRWRRPTHNLNTVGRLRVFTGVAAKKKRKNRMKFPPRKLFSFALGRDRRERRNGGIYFARRKDFCFSPTTFDLLSLSLSPSSSLSRYYRRLASNQRTIKILVVLSRSITLFAALSSGDSWMISLTPFTQFWHFS